MLISRGVNVFPTQLEEQILKCQGLAPHYQILLGREGRMDTMTVRVEAATDAAGDAAREASGRELAGYVKGVVGITAKVDVVEPGGVERSMGKAVRVVDQRG